ncbi:MAG: heavy metal translocating P-type ATPase [Bacillota bacterium]
MQKELLLEGLGCANCAQKIEDKVKKLKGVKVASVNFATSTMNVEFEPNKNTDQLLEEIRNIVVSIESHVILTEKKRSKDQTKSLLLLGLDCANCANKIEIKLKSLKGIRNVSVDYVNRKLKFDLEDKNKYPQLLKEIEKVIKEIEPDVEIQEEVKKKNKNKVEIIMKGLHCASCATKIDDNVKKLEGLKEANVDFVNNKLILYVKEADKIDAITEEAVKIIKKFEPQLELEIIKNDIKPKENQSEKTKDKMKLIKLGIGAALFALALIFKFSFNIELGLFLISYVLVGGEVLTRAIKNIFRGQVFDENFLMTIATVGAFLIGEFPEAVAVMLFYQVGETFQDIAVNRSRKSIKALMDIRPDYANVLIDGVEEQVDPDELSVGDIIIVKPGEKVPLDGKIIEGTTMVDTSALTGESVPRKIEVGEEILSGSINKTGLVKVEVTKEFGDSTVSKIIDLVQNASSRKAPTENFITKFARYYTPVVVISAAALAFIPPLVIEGATFSDWIYRALVFLVISCPCALVVSIPLGFFGGIGGASKNGVLIKGGNYLEALNYVSTVVFDKTGTLTKGVFKVTDIKLANNFTKEQLLENTALAEVHSNHPIAKSILEAYGKKPNPDLIESYEEIAGHGVKVKAEGKEILAGNLKLMEVEKIEYLPNAQVGTVVHVAVDRVYAGSILIADEIKRDAKEAIENLRKTGVKKIVMLTGDNKKVGEYVANELGLDKVYTELLPDNKVEKVEELLKDKGKDEKLVFVGDGINDAPVLARADIGVAMGGLGSDAAIEAADVVIMTDEPSKLVSAIKIAKRTKAIVWQNIVFALGVKGFFLLLGAVGIATMWEAVFADVGVSVIAVLNAMRVMKVKNI